MLEQRHKAVLEVLNGATVTDVARRYSVARRLRRSLATCPHQMPYEVEARVCAIRRERPG